jgi:PQQ-dependent dehydrogenase (s-GDH family)
MMQPYRKILVLPLVMAATVLVVAQDYLADRGVDTHPPEKFAMRVVTPERVMDPWDLQFGPDGKLWVTERGSKSVIQIDPATGAKTTLVTIDDAILRDTQDGVLGLALHPQLLKGRGLDYVYVSYVYDADPGPARVRQMRLRRYTYDRASSKLAQPLDLITAVPSFGDHAGGRLLMGADQTLYLTIGDLAANHMSNVCAPNHAQDLPTAEDVAASSWTAYQGKVLRLNLDGSIPVTNPVLGGVRSHVYSYGHRNPQGLALGADGKIYESEHGPSSDDEVNLIRAGKNYGWPYVAGFQDDLWYLYANYSASSPEPCRTLSFNPFGGPASLPQQKETAWSHPDFTPPLKTFFTVNSNYDMKGLGNAVIAPSGIEVYKATGAGAIPGWSNSILVTSLFKDAIFRVKLSADGTTAVGNPVAYFREKNRYRDVTVSPDGKTIFVSTDNWGVSTHPGAILAFTYQGNQ